MNSLQDETSGWLQENSRSLLVSIAVILGAGLVLWYLPRARQASLEESWQRFTAFEERLAEVDSASALDDALVTVEGDERVYPWALLQAVGWAGSEQDAEAIAMLRSRFSQLPEQPTNVRMLVDGEALSLTEAAETRLAGLEALAQLEPALAEPTGSRIKVTLSSAEGVAYELIYQLYEERVPETSAWLLGLLDAGAFAEATLIPTPGNGFQVGNLADEEAEPRLIERAWGCFHRSGTLCTVLASGGSSGQQDPGRLAFLGRDLYGQDGVTTVVGKIVEGEEHLATIGALEAAPDDPRAYATPLTLSVERLAD